VNVPDVLLQPPPIDDDVARDDGGGDDGKPIRWVTIVSFHNVEDAHLARLRLEAHDIPVFIADYHITAIAWHYALAVRGAKVQVPAEFLADAREVLAGELAARRGELVSHDGACPRCRSPHVRGGRAGRRLLCLFLLATFVAGIHLLVPMIVLLAGVCYIAFTVTSICQECGYEWRASPQRGFEVLPP
jgi:hypothetical protein